MKYLHEDASPVDEVAEPDDARGVPDDRLRLTYTCCHPALALAAQIALTLRTLGGLTTDEIARAVLTSPATMAQRLVRAQSKIKTARVPYEVPEPSQLAERTVVGSAPERRFLEGRLAEVTAAISA